MREGCEALVCGRDCLVELVCVHGECKVRRVKGVSRERVKQAIECGLVPLAEHFTGEGVRLGVTEAGLDYVIDLELLWRHVLIAGATGSGKTATAIRILRELDELGIPVVVFDWAGEYESRLLSTGFSGLKVLRGRELPPVSLVPEAVPVEAVVDGLRRALGLSEQQATVLQQLLLLIDAAPPQLALRLSLVDHETYADFEKALELVRNTNSVSALLELCKAMWRVVEEVEPLAALSRSEREVWAALARRLQSIAYSKHSHLFRIKGNYMTVMVRDAEKYGHVILDVSSIENRRLRALYTALALSALFELRVRAIGPPLLALVEEAHNIAETSHELLLHLLAEARKHGLGLILVTSLPARLGEEGIANVGVIVAHRGAERGFPKLRELVKLDTESLSPGEAVVVSALAPGRVKVVIDVGGAA